MLSKNRAVYIAVAVLVVSVLVAIPLFTGAVSILLVDGNSMHPGMPDGSVALCHDTTGWNVTEGDVVAIELRDRYIVHEVVHAETEYSRIDEPIDRRIQTKGWNNDIRDPAVPPHLVECEVSIYVTPGLDVRTA